MRAWTITIKEKLENVVVLVSKDGQRAAAEFNVHGVYKATDSGLPDAKGQKYVLPAGTFFAIRDGKIARVTTYYNLTDWIAQVTGVSQAARNRIQAQCSSLC